MKLFDHLEIPYEDDADKQDYTIQCLYCGSDNCSISKADGNVWQCWKCHESGNALTLMQKFYAELPRLTPSTARQFLAKKKGVSFRTMVSEGLRYDGQYYWFPVWNQNEKLVALHKYSVKSNIAYASPKPWSCSVLGLSQLTSSSEIYIAEGHADYLVMRELLKNSKIDLLGTCGSGFSGNYLHVLRDKDVTLLFDNDDAGRQGVQSVARRLKSTGTSVSSIKFLDWSKITLSEHSVIPDKFDIRDLVLSLRDA